MFVEATAVLNTKQNDILKSGYLQLKQWDLNHIICILNKTKHFKMTKVSTKLHTQKVRNIFKPYTHPNIFGEFLSLLLIFLQKDFLSKLCLENYYTQKAIIFVFLLETLFEFLYSACFCVCISIQVFVCKTTKV